MEETLLKIIDLIICRFYLFLSLFVICFENLVLGNIIQKRMCVLLNVITFFASARKKERKKRRIDLKKIYRFTGNSIPFMYPIGRKKIQICALPMKLKQC